MDNLKFLRAGQVDLSLTLGPSLADAYRGEGPFRKSGAPVAEVVRASFSAALGVGALAVGLGGWLRRAATPAERTGAGVAGLLLVYPSAAADIAGLIIFLLVSVLHVARVRSA